MITTLEQMVEKVRLSGNRQRIAVAWAQDPNTVTAVHEAVRQGFAEACMIGDPGKIADTCRKAGLDETFFTVVPSDNEYEASRTAVKMARNDEADVVMKGLVGTDIFLRAVMDKENGLLLPDAVLTYVCAMEIPAYHKLLFLTDPAVIPFPDLDQKIAMVKYAVGMAAQFGIEKPKVALIGATEKMSRHFSNNTDYAVMCKMADRGQLKNCIIDGPVDIFLACDRKSVEIKGVETPVNGDADILLFPSLESSNPFYKGLMLFASGELAGLIRGTSRPVVMMSRSESERSKFFCIALSCLMA